MIDSKYPYHKNTNDPDNTRDPKKLKILQNLQTWNLNFQKKTQLPPKNQDPGNLRPKIKDPIVQATLVWIIVAHTHNHCLHEKSHRVAY